MSPAVRKRRSQAERRAETRAAVLESAMRLFGTKGYAQTSVEEIAAASGTTIRPVYHYFGGKKQLFEAANEVMEERILSGLQAAGPVADADLAAAWRSFLELCRDPIFRQIVLVDAPNVLGRARWESSPVTRAALALFRDPEAGEGGSARLVARMLVAALGEAALVIAESEDPEAMSRRTEEVVSRAIPALLGREDAR